MSSQPEPIFIQLDPDHPSTEIESLCMKCHEKGTTRLLLTDIAHFHQVVVSSFECPHCGYENKSIQTAQPLQKKGCKISIHVDSSADLNRQIVLTEYCTVQIPQIELEMPSSENRSLLTTIEGLLSRIQSNLQVAMEEQTAESSRQALGKTIDKIESFLQLGEHFSIILDDPSGNSYVESYSQPDNQMSLEYYQRTFDQLKVLGYATEPEFSSPAMTTDEEGIRGDDEKSTDSQLFEEMDEKINIFHTMCSSCQADCETKMCNISIPYFKDVVIMATTCDSCGFKSSEIKTCGGISPKGKIITLKLTDEEDLNRDVLKSETASLSIPEIHLELDYGSLGGKFTTIEGLLNDISDEIEQKFPFATGDASESNPNQQIIKSLAEKISAFTKGNFPEGGISIIIDDPLANSYIQNLFAPDPDPNLAIAEYERSFEQNESLGLNDIKV